jgi:hypothetical protein
MRHTRRALGASCAIAAALGCSSSSGGGGYATLGDDAGADATIGGDAASAITLRVDPPTVSLSVVLGGASTTAPVKVWAKAPGAAAETDVTATATLTLDDPTLAAVTGPGTIGNATRGGTGTIYADAQGATATAALQVKLTGELVPAGFDPGVKGSFGTAPVDSTPANQPKIEYPLDGVIVPANVPPMQAQWTTAGDSKAYRVHLTAPDVLDVFVYATTREVAADAAPWAKIVASAAGKTVDFVVEGVGASLHRSDAVHVQVATDRIDDSAIYYWESSSGSMHVLDVGAGTNATLPVTGSAYAPGSASQCVACHTVSRDGTRFSYTTGGFALGTLKAAADKKSFAASIEPGTKVPGGFKWTYAAFNPSEAATGAAVLVSKADVTSGQNTPGHVRLAMLDPDTGAELGSNLTTWLAAFPAGVGKDILQPDWSPAGFVVFSAYDSEGSNPDPASPLTKAYVRDLGDDAVASSIVEAPVAWDSSKNSYTFGAPKVLVSAKAGAFDVAETDVLPQIAPDDSLVAFTRSSGWWPIRLQSDAVNGTGRIVVVRRSDGVVTELTNASGPANSNSTWPQWAPTVGSTYLWLAFSSERPYGHIMAPGAALPPACLPQGRSLCKNMWIAAVDKKKAMSGTLDPSAPPFWLPGQTALASAVSPRWTKAVVVGPK